VPPPCFTAPGALERCTSCCGIRMWLGRSKLTRPSLLKESEPTVIDERDFLPVEIAPDDTEPADERLERARHELLEALHSAHLKGSGYKAGVREKIENAMAWVDDASDTLMQGALLVSERKARP